MLRRRERRLHLHSDQQPHHPRAGEDGRAARGRLRQHRHRVGHGRRQRGVHGAPRRGQAHGVPQDRLRPVARHPRQDVPPVWGGHLLRRRVRHGGGPRRHPPRDRPHLPRIAGEPDDQHLRHPRHLRARQGARHPRLRRQHLPRALPAASPGDGGGHCGRVAHQVHQRPRRHRRRHGRHAHGGALQDAARHAHQPRREHGPHPGVHGAAGAQDAAAPSRPGPGERAQGRPVPRGPPHGQVDPVPGPGVAPPV
mmetsp:Transcript_2548/g.5368  ORF Transcript_2548/g.5368 Transcript_2548/m.5368 type:complete len:252 (-) Transcript_2548:332-1087(-)